MALSRRSALAPLGRTRKSTSAEYRGYPCQETASAPTTRYSTLFEFKHSTNSRKSLLNGIGVGSLAKLEKNVDPFLRAHSGPGTCVLRVRLGEAVKDANDSLHRSYSTPKALRGSRTVLSTRGL